MNLKGHIYNGLRILVLTVPPVGFLIARSSAANPVLSFPGIWPPVGSLETFAAPLATLLVTAFSCWPLRIKEKTKAERLSRWSITFAVFAFFIYGGLVAKFVKTVPTNNYGIQFRSIGYERTARALSEEPNADDVELLEDAGLGDAGIEKAWTSSSVWVVRMGLFVSYVGFLGALGYWFGSLSQQQALEVCEPNRRSTQR